MSKIFKCFVCGLLGIVIGAGATFGAMAAAVYYSYGNVTVSSVIGNNEYNDVLGDLKDFSVDEILGLIQKGQANPENYTFRDLELKYGFDMVALINKFGGGNDKIIADDGSNAKYVEQLKDVSPFTILKGGDGAKKFLDNLPFGAVLSFIPSSAMFAENERVILRRYSVGDMFKKDPITGETGIAGALREVRVGGVFPVLFDYDETSDTYKVKDGKYSGLSLVGNLKFGPFIDVATGKKDVTSVLGESGFFTDKTLGEYLELLGVTDEKITERIDAALSGLTISGLFNKNYETGKYEFVLENLLGSVSIGGALGYVYEDGVWYKNKDKTETVEGLMAVIASFDLTKIYRALKGDAGAWEKIREIALSLGDASFGDILETFGYKYNGEKWLNKDGKEPKVGMLVAMSDVRVSDLLGGKDELDATKLRVKIAKEIMLHCGDMTLGDGFGGLLKVSYDEEKKAYVWSEGSNAGKEINGALNELLLTDINDIAQIFAQEKIDGKQIERVLLTLTDGIKVGYVLGANRADDGTWTSGQGKAIESKYYKFYEVTLDKLIAPFFDGAEASDIFDIFIDALGEDTTLGEVVAPFFGCDVDKNGKIVYTGTNLESFAFAIDKIFRVALKELKNKEDRFGAVMNAAKSITLGNIMGFEVREDGNWYDLSGTKKEADTMTDKIFVKLYSKTIKEITEDSGVFDDVLDDFTIGEMMNLKYCDGTGEKCDVGSSHTHAAGWYKEDGVTRANVAEEKLAGITLKQISDDGLDLEQIYTGTKLGEMMNAFYSQADEKWYEDKNFTTEVDEIMQKVYDLDLGQLIAGKTEFDSVIADISVGEVMKLKHCGGADDNCDVDHTSHAAGWYDENGKEASVIESKLADKTLGDLMKNGLDIESTFTGTKLGEMLSGVTFTDGKWYEEAADGSKTEAEKMMSTIYDIDLGKLLSGDVDLKDVIGGVSVGDVMKLEYCDGTTCNTGHDKHEAGWYKKDETTGEYTKVSLIEKTLADKTFNDLLDGGLDLADMFKDNKLGEMINGVKLDDATQKWLDEDGKAVNAVMQKIYDLNLGEVLTGKADIESVINGMSVGEAMKKHKQGDKWYDENEAEETDAIMLALYDCKLSDLLNGNLNIKDAIKDVTLGAAAGVEKNADGSWKTADVVMKKLYDEKLGNILDGHFNLGSALGGVAMGEVLGYTNDNGVWKDGATAITDPITKKICALDIGQVLGGNVQFDILFNDVKLGEMMGCTYCDGIDCSLSHAHAEGWYDNGGKVTGITAVMVGLTVAEVKNGTFTQKLNDLTLQDVVGEIKNDDPLSLIGGGTKLGEISGKMKDISNATLGKFRQVGIITAKEEQLDDAFGKILKLVANDIAKGDENSPTYEAGHVYQFSEDIRTEAAAYITVDSTTGTVTYKTREFWSNMTFTRMMDCMIAASNSLKV